MISLRKEKDILGDVDVPIDAYYGSFTSRALDNFQISGIRIQQSLILGLIIGRKNDDSES